MDHDFSEVVDYSAWVPAEPFTCQNHFCQREFMGDQSDSDYPEEFCSQECQKEIMS